MVAPERLLSRDKERKRKELELSRFSHSLSHAILTENGRAPVGNTLPDTYVASFQKGSHADRSLYWQEHAGQENFGMQMMLWVGAGDKSGMVQWLDKQNDPDVVGMLQEVGLRGTPESLQVELKGERVIQLLAVINADLEKAGQDIISPEILSQPDSENFARSLVFYANYLNPTDKDTTDTRSLIDRLTAYASSGSNGNVAVAIEMLQKIAPLLQVAGEEGQHILGALIVAKVHLEDGRDILHEAGKAGVPLKDDEQEIVAFLTKHAEDEIPVALEVGKPHVIQDVLQNLKADPTPGHPYWIEREIPADFAQGLTREQLQSLELQRSYWIWDKNTRRMVPSSEFSQPETVLAQNARFLQARALTNDESSLLALASASAETPDEQTALYKVLGETVLRAHTANQQLLENFLRAQTHESLEKFGDIDSYQAQYITDQKHDQLQMGMQKEFEDRFGKPFTTNAGRTSDENEFVARRSQEILAKEVEFASDVLRNFSQYPERHVAVENVFVTEDNLLQQIEPHVNIPETADVWHSRATALQEALQQNPLMLTPEQMSQMEFLAHSIDIQKVMHWLQNGGAIEIEATTPPPPPVEQSTEIPLQKDTVEVPSIALDAFFASLDEAKTNLLGSIQERRQEL